MRSVLKVVLMSAFALVIANNSFADSKINFSNRCKLQKLADKVCLQSNSRCTLNAVAYTKSGKVAGRREVSFGIAGVFPKDLSLNFASLIRTTNRSGRAQLNINPRASIKGKEITITLLPAVLGPSNIDSASLNFSICN